MALPAVTLPVAGLTVIVFTPVGGGGGGGAATVVTLTTQCHSCPSWLR